MNRYKNLLAGLAFSLLIFGLPAMASAQWRNNRNDTNGAFSERNMHYTLNRLEDNSRDFARKIDRSLDRSRYNETKREDRIDDIAGRFRDAVDKLEDNYDGGNNGRDDSYAEAQAVLTLADRLENVLRRNRLADNLQGDWNLIRQDLNTIANYYGYNNRGNRGRRNNGNGRNSRFPY